MFHRIAVLDRKTPSPSLYIILRQLLKVTSSLDFWITKKLVAKLTKISNVKLILDLNTIKWVTEEWKSILLRNTILFLLKFHLICTLGTKYSRMDQINFVEGSLYGIWRGIAYLSRPYPYCLPQILLGLFLNTLSHFRVSTNMVYKKNTSLNFNSKMVVYSTECLVFGYHGRITEEDWQLLSLFNSILVQQLCTFFREKSKDNVI